MDLIRSSLNPLRAGSFTCSQLDPGWPGALLLVQALVWLFAFGQRLFPQSEHRTMRMSDSVIGRQVSHQHSLRAGGMGEAA